MQFFKIYEKQPGESIVRTAVPFLLAIGLFAGAIILWVLAQPIARFVTRKLPQDISFGDLSLVDCYSIAFIGIGLLYIASDLPVFLIWGHFLFKTAASTSGDSWKKDVDFYDAAHAIIPFIVGVMLFVNGRSWAVTLAARQLKTTRKENT